MKLVSNPPKMLIVSSYPPVECGIATFTRDLIHAIAKTFGSSLPIEICALERSVLPERTYAKEVSYILNTSKLADYRLMAHVINERDDIGTVCIQHEFGLFDGVYGEALLSFMLALNTPIVAVFHTVLPHPDEKLKRVVDAICDLSEKIIVQNQCSFKILIADYNCPKKMVKVIPHGTHIMLWKDKEYLKNKYNYNQNLILSSFGLLSPNKNIETVLYALPEVVARYPEIRYLVLGKTHPELVKREGERYRESLISISRQLQLENNVIFVNKFLELGELLEYLNLSDIYLFSSKDPNQAVSGTFVYASSAGCPVISTPIPPAIEIIDAGTGILLDEFEQPEAFKRAILHLIDNKEKRIELGKNAFSKMRHSSWENAAIAYGGVFAELNNKAERLIFELPPVNLTHVREMTTDFGILQFSQFCQPDPNSGYTLDDNARALIASVMHYDLYKEELVLKQMQIYLDFIGFVQLDNGSFKNYVDFDRRFTDQNEKVNLEDSNGRALWALGYLLSKTESLPSSLTQQALKYWDKAFPLLDNFTSPRAIGFVIKGLYYNFLFSKDETNVVLTEKLAERLLHYYNLKSDAKWKWYEDYMTYANSILPEAMMYAFLMTAKTRYNQIAEITFDFLLSHYFMKGKIKVISNNGWFNKRNKRNFFGEQPIEVAYIIFSLDLFYEFTKKSKYKNQLETAFSWFTGNNHLNQIMYNPANGACYDGLEKYHININQGAESAVCYLMARLVMEKYTVSQALSPKTKVLTGVSL